MQSPEEYEVTERINLLFKQLKEQRGYTKKMISQRLGIGLTTLNDYMNGVSSFKLVTLMKIADLCRVRLADILDADAFFKKYNEQGGNRKLNDFIVVAGLIFGFSFGHSTLIVLILLFTLLFFYSKGDSNSRFLSLSFSIVRILELTVFYFILSLIHGKFGYFIDVLVFFGAQLLFSFTLLMLVKNRRRVMMSLSETFIKIKVSDIFKVRYSDSVLYLLVLFACFFDLLALLEGLINNLEYFGFSREFAKQYWDIDYIYSIYSQAKLTLNILIILTLFMEVRINKLEQNKTCITS